MAMMCAVFKTLYEEHVKPNYKRSQQYTTQQQQQHVDECEMKHLEQLYLNRRIKLAKIKAANGEFIAEMCELARRFHEYFKLLKSIDDPCFTDNRGGVEFKNANGLYRDFIRYADCMRAHAGWSLPPYDANDDTLVSAMKSKHQIDENTTAFSTITCKKITPPRQQQQQRPKPIETINVGEQRQPISDNNFRSFTQSFGNTNMMSSAMPEFDGMSSQFGREDNNIPFEIQKQSKKKQKQKDDKKSTDISQLNSKLPFETDMKLPSHSSYAAMGVDYMLQQQQQLQLQQSRYLTMESPPIYSANLPSTTLSTGIPMPSSSSSSSSFNRALPNMSPIRPISVKASVENYMIPSHSTNLSSSQQLRQQMISPMYSKELMLMSSNSTQFGGEEMYRSKDLTSPMDYLSTIGAQSNYVGSNLPDPYNPTGAPFTYLSSQPTNNGMMSRGNITASYENAPTFPLERNTRSMAPTTMTTTSKKMPQTSKMPQPSLVLDSELYRHPSAPGTYTMEKPMDPMHQQQIYDSRYDSSYNPNEGGVSTTSAQIVTVRLGNKR